MIFDVEIINDLLTNSLHSLRRVFVGVALASVAGIVFGILRSQLPLYIKRNKLISFMLDAPKFPPPIAWIPFVIVLFGIGEISAYTIVFTGAFSPIFTNTFEGAESISLTIKNTARSIEIRGIKYLYQIVFKASLPQIFTGIRVGTSMGWMSVIAAEMISGQSGLGYSIQLNRLNLQYSLMFVDVFMIGVIGFFLFEGVRLVERKIIPWNIRIRSQTKQQYRRY